MSEQLGNHRDYIWLITATIHCASMLDKGKTVNGSRDLTEESNSGSADGHKGLFSDCHERGRHTAHITDTTDPSQGNVGGLRRLIKGCLGCLSAIGKILHQGGEKETRLHIIGRRIPLESEIADECNFLDYCYRHSTTRKEFDILRSSNQYRQLWQEQLRQRMA